MADPLARARGYPLPWGRDGRLARPSGVSSAIVASVFLAGSVGLFVASPSLRAADSSAAPAPVIFQSGSGRFEIAGTDATGTQRVVARADAAWRLLAAPLGLPEAFPTPVLVRLIPAKDWREASPFHVFVEAGGVVSVRIRWEDTLAEPLLQRALVQGLLMRLAVAQHGVSEHLAVPLWLEQACVGWWRTRAEAAEMDALKQRSAAITPPALGELLAWQRGESEPPERVTSAVWLLAFLQEETSRAGEWPALLSRLLGGDDPAAALAASFPGRFTDAGSRELWWRTGWHHLRQVHTLPTLEAAESREVLAGLARFVFAGDDGRDTVVPLATVLAHAAEPIAGAELNRRRTELNRVLPALHPFYRNAGLSLAEALGAAGAPAAKCEQLGATYAQDWREATELEIATTTALDRMEGARGSAAAPRNDE